MSSVIKPSYQNTFYFSQVKKTIDADPFIKLIFLCSPGNPTGTLISLASIRALLDYEPFKGIVVIDEAYIDFSEPGSSAAPLVAEYANLCVMQTLSKSFGLAAIRCVYSHFSSLSCICSSPPCCADSA
jgi:histidinol-phosphate/aromatic aminotransferase/cobyric acid decarboxylase-like protein